MRCAKAPCRWVDARLAPPGPYLTRSRSLQLGSLIPGRFGLGQGGQFEGVLRAHARPHARRRPCGSLDDLSVCVCVASRVARVAPFMYNMCWSTPCLFLVIERDCRSLVASCLYGCVTTTAMHWFGRHCLRMPFWRTGRSKLPRPSPFQKVPPTLTLCVGGVGSVRQPRRPSRRGTGRQDNFGQPLGRSLSTPSGLASDSSLETCSHSASHRSQGS